MTKQAERKDVQNPLWRKKVDNSIFRYGGTHIPEWVCAMWGISDDFSGCRSVKNDNAIVTVELYGENYIAHVTETPRKDSDRVQYRLWFGDHLRNELKEEFLMSYMREIESRLRRSDQNRDKSSDNSNATNNDNIELEIPFWEFLDIEYERANKCFSLVPHFKQKPYFPLLFKRLAEIDIVEKIESELLPNES